MALLGPLSLIYLSPCPQQNKAKRYFQTSAKETQEF